ncbi:MAG TPA: hypothetical protein VGN72_12760 [Tepidisphaeraceae bacterium]|jgi:predicted peptidase|nr:hypothetical protein [Tepidisphaeraceae bacterium]
MTTLFVAVDAHAQMADIVLKLEGASGPDYRLKDFTHYNARSTVNSDRNVYGRLYVPDNYNASHSYPLVTFLHGDGEAANRNAADERNISQVDTNIYNLLRNARSRGFMVYVPQSPGTFWGDEQMFMSEFSTCPFRARVTQRVDL